MGQPWTVETAAAELLECADQRRDRAALSGQWPDLDAATGYAVADEVLRRRLDRGEKLIGVKVGVTNRADQERLGGSGPVVGWLTDAMIVPAGEPVPQHRLLRPAAEPEIVFVLRDRLAGPGVTAASAFSAVEAVACGVEIVDSRFTDGAPTLGDLLADNVGAAAFVTGPLTVPPGEVDLFTEGVLVEVDGEITHTAAGAATCGHPGQALAHAANVLAARGLAIEAGWVVLSGGLSPAVPAPPGSSIACHFGSLGSVYLHGGPSPG